MKRINYFYLLMIAIICAVVLRAQSDKPKQVTTYDNPIVHTTIGKIVVDTPKPGVKTSPGNELDNKTYPWDFPRDSVKLLPKNSWKDLKLNSYGITITSARKGFISVTVGEDKSVEVRKGSIYVAKRDTAGHWQVINAEAALETLWEFLYPHMKKEYLISKMLSYVDDNGYVSDWQEFQKSVIKYRQFIKQ